MHGCESAIDIRNCGSLDKVLGLDDTWAGDAFDRESPLVLLSIVAVGGSLNKVDLSVEVWGRSRVDGGAKASSTSLGLWTSGDAVA